MQLTDSQRCAVETKASEVLVIAGAGSGKTQVLVERIAHLIWQRGVSPADLMVLTFTRKAAAEMIERIEQRFGAIGGAPEIRGMLIGTFHSVALRILRAEAEAFGYDAAHLTVIDPDDADTLYQQVCRDLGYLRADGKTWRGDLSWKKAKRRLEQWYTQPISQGDEHGIDPAIDEYHTRLKALNALDFGMILSETNRLFDERPAVLKRWQARIKHVLVDELQDMDEMQYNLHLHFAPPATFFGVGDRRQSIYGFRGARPDMMTAIYRNAEMINLRECFRCGGRIVDAANKLIEHNSDELAEPMVGATGRLGRTDVAPGRSADIAAAVNTAHGFDFYDWQQIAVLARKHSTLRRVAELMQIAKIPHHVVGQGFEITKTDGFRLVHAALRLCVNPADDLAFMRLVPATGISVAAGYGLIRAQAAEQNESHFAAYYRLTLTSEYASPHDAFLRIAEYHDAEEPPSVDRIAAELDDALGTAAAHWWTCNCAGMTVQVALDWFALRDSQDDLAVGDKVTLCTIHAAKGLEWPAVIVAECNEGSLPSAMSLREDSGVEEERRVAYVAMTRAKQSLKLHYRRKCDQNQDRKTNPPSRFLRECGVPFTADEPDNEHKEQRNVGAVTSQG